MIVYEHQSPLAAAAGMLSQGNAPIQPRASFAIAFAVSLATVARQRLVVVATAGLKIVEAAENLPQRPSAGLCTELVVNADSMVPDYVPGSIVLGAAVALTVPAPAASRLC